MRRKKLRRKKPKCAKNWRNGKTHRLAKMVGAEPSGEMRGEKMHDGTEMRGAHNVAVKTYKTHHVRNIFGN